MLKKYGFIIVFIIALLLRTTVILRSSKLGPDWEHHLAYFKFLVLNNGRSPTKDEAFKSPKTLSRVRYDLHEAILQPPGFYMFIYPFYKAYPVENTIRWFNVIFGSLSCVAVYFILKALYPKNIVLPILSGLFLAVQPTHIYLSSVVNNDMAVGLTATLFLASLCYLLRYMTDKNKTYGNIFPISMLTGFFLGLSVWIKYSAVSLFGVYAGSVFIWFILRNFKIEKLNKIILIIIPLIIALLILVPLSLWNCNLGFGAFEFLSAHLKYQIKNYPPDIFQFYIFHFPKALFSSFWGGLPGSSSFFLIKMIKYAAVLFFCFSFFIGLKKSFFELKKNPVWIVLYMSSALAVIGVIYWNYVGYIPSAFNANARFLIPAFASFASFIAYGGDKLGRKLFGTALFLIALSTFIELFA